MIFGAAARAALGGVGSFVSSYTTPILMGGVALVIAAALAWHYSEVHEAYYDGMRAANAANKDLAEKEAARLRIYYATRANRVAAQMEKQRVADYQSMAEQAVYTLSLEHELERLQNGDAEAWPAEIVRGIKR